MRILSPNRNGDPPSPLPGAVLEGGAAFVLTLVVLAIFWIHEVVHGRRLPDGSWIAGVGIATTAALFFAVVSFFRLRRLRRLASTQAPCREADPLVASCLECYEDGLEDVTARFRADLARPVWVDRVLEERTWSVHRVVVFLQTATNSLDLVELKVELARCVRARLHGSWVRGLGLGIVLRCSNLQLELQHLYAIVDGCGGPTVILQWFILADEATKRGLAVHMPVPGKTTPCFLAAITRLSVGDDYSFEIALKEKTGIYRKLCAVESAVPPWLHVLLPFLH